MNIPAAEIALELTIQTGQVYTCPDENHISSHDRCFYIRQDWERRQRMAISATGQNCDPCLRADEKKITVDPTRQPAELARDILRRLPDAPGVYARANATHAKREAEKASHAEVVAELESHGFAPHGWGQSETHAKMYKGRVTIEFYNAAQDGISFNCSKISLNQLYQLMETLNNDRPTD